MPNGLLENVGSRFLTPSGDCVRLAHRSIKQVVWGALTMCGQAFLGTQKPKVFGYLAIRSGPQSDAYSFMR